MTKDEIKKVINEVLVEYQTSSEPLYQQEQGVISCDIKKIKPEKFDTGKPGDNVLLKEVFNLQQSKNLGCGVMEMTKTTFEWFLDYDEIDYVIEGELKININGKQICAKKGEVVLIPKNTKIEFCVEEFARFMYVTYPADWENN